MSRANNTSGFPGIRQRPNGRWEARIGYRNRQRHLGVYATPEEASAAYEQEHARLYNPRRSQ